MEQRARTALAGVGAGDALRTKLELLWQFTERDPVDTISLRRQIAARIIEQGKYVV